MTEIWTLGHPSRRTQFRYEGTVSSGVTLLQKGKPSIEVEFFAAALNAFRGRDDGRSLTPRHASFIAAILCHEAGVISRLDGSAVWLKFP